MAWLAGLVISQLRGAAVTEITISVAFAYLTFVVGAGVSPRLGHYRGRDGGDGVCLRRAHAAFARHVGHTAHHVAAARVLGDVTDLYLGRDAGAATCWATCIGRSGLAIGALFFAALVARALVLWGFLPMLSWFGLSQPICNEYKSGALLGQSCAAR